MATGNPPFADIRNKRQLVYNIIHVDVPEMSGDWSDQFKDFVNCCLKRNPNERYHMKQLLYEHPFLAGIDTNKCRDAWMEDVKRF